MSGLTQFFWIGASLVSIFLLLRTTQEESVFIMMAQVFRTWIGVVVPLLLIGALVEAFITGKLFAIKGGNLSF